MPQIVACLNDSAGTFKTRFIEYAREKGITVINARESHHFPTGIELLVVVKNRSVPGLSEERMSRLHKIKIVNTKTFARMTKPEIQDTMRRAGIPVPLSSVIAYQVSYTSSPYVVKPIRGECGMGIQLVSRPPRPNEYTQEFIGVPESLGTSFDLRIYTFLGKYMGSTIRLANPDNVKNVGGRLFGLTNTHKGGTMLYFESDMAPRCPVEMRQYRKKIWNWLGVIHPRKEWIETAERIAALFNLGYCGIDFIFKSPREYYAIDVNPNAMMGNRTTNDIVRMKRTLEIMDKVEGEMN